MAIAQRIRRFLGRHDLLGDKILVIGCSGGPDSMVLCHATVSLYREGDIGQPVLLYVDHGLRPESTAEGAQVRAFAADLGARFEERRVRVDASRASLEEAAREARYQAFEDVAATFSARGVLLAHHAGDQAETVLMRILRGTGLLGLGGIREVRGHYYRPLISTTRAEILEYARSHGLPTVSDPMNDDPRFFRSRVRHHWLPALSAENPEISDALIRLGTMAQSLLPEVEFAAQAALAAAAEDPSTVSATRLHSAPEGTRRRAIALWAEACGIGPLSSVHLDSAVRLLGDQRGEQSLDWPGGKLVRSYDSLRFSAAEDRLPAVPDVEVQGPGGPYVVRSWQAGDRMRPARLRGRSKKLSDLYIDRKVPRSARGRARVVVDSASDEIVWAEHVGLAADAAVEVCLTPPRPGATNRV